MKTTVIAAVASLGLTVGGAARPERPHVAHVQLAAGGGSHPQADSNEHATQLAAGNHPQAETNERAIQLAPRGSIPSASPMATTPEQYLGKRAHGTMKRIVSRFRHCARLADRRCCYRGASIREPIRRSALFRALGDQRGRQRLVLALILARQDGIPRSHGMWQRVEPRRLVRPSRRSSRTLKVHGRRLQIALCAFVDISPARGAASLRSSTTIPRAAPGVPHRGRARRLPGLDSAAPGSGFNPLPLWPNCATAVSSRYVPPLGRISRFRPGRRGGGASCAGIYEMSSLRN